MGELIELFGPERMSPARKMHLSDRLANLAVEIALLEAERDRLETLLQEAEHG